MPHTICDLLVFNNFFKKRNCVSYEKFFFYEGELPESRAVALEVHKFPPH